jgi:hypothetical protein
MYEEWEPMFLGEVKVCFEYRQLPFVRYLAGGASVEAAFSNGDGYAFGKQPVEVGEMPVIVDWVELRQKLRVNTESHLYSGVAGRPLKELAPGGRPNGRYHECFNASIKCSLQNGITVAVKT